MCIYCGNCRVKNKVQIIVCIGLVIGELELVSAEPTFDPVSVGREPPDPPLLPVVSTLPSSSSLRVTRVMVYIHLTDFISK